MFNQDESNLIYKLASELTGTCQNEKNRHSVLVSSVWRRMQELKINQLKEYLSYVNLNEKEYPNLVSALTIHTTSWFRELPHFEKLKEQIKDFHKMNLNRPFKVLSGACSTGQEVYSIGLVLDDFRSKNPGFEYALVGRDIDPVSVKKGNSGIYPESECSQIPKDYEKYILRGSGKSKGFFTFKKEIRTRCKWLVGSLKDIESLYPESFDLIFCRNVLIYFDQQSIDKIISSLGKLLSDVGVLCLGHSEAVDPSKHKLIGRGNSTYVKAGSKLASSSENSSENKSGAPTTKARKDLLVVDDSTTMRKLLSSILSSDDIIVHDVGSAKEATEFLKTKNVDLITLDLHMPGEDGQTWLKAQRNNGMRVPVVIVSGASPQEALEVLGALENGAQDYIDKQILKTNKDDVVNRIIALSNSRKNRSSKLNVKEDISKLKVVPPDLILLGASTGGTDVLAKFLTKMPSNCPPVIITQHITKAFAKPFAERLANISGLELGANNHDLVLENNKLYMAHEDYHIGVSQKVQKLHLVISHADPVQKHRPSVDFLFKSGGLLNNTNIFAALFTGMGADGAKGLLDLKAKGAFTCAQDEDSCVVYGMPKEAIKLDAAKFIGDPAEIQKVMYKAIGLRK